MNIGWGRVAAGAAVVLGALGFFAPIEVAGQAGTAQSTYRAPRTPEGQPDFTGIWQSLNSANWDIQDHTGALGVPPGQGVVEGNEVPYQPWALKQKEENFKNRDTADPDSKCFIPGVPRVMYQPFPFQIVQAPQHIYIGQEKQHFGRIIYLDPKAPKPDDIEMYMGHSRGRWDGDTLVVETTNNNAETWFDRAGNFHSEALRVVERITRTGPDHLQYEATIEDPKVFTRPWKMSMPLYRRQEKNLRLLEYECVQYLQEDKWKTGLVD